MSKATRRTFRKLQTHRGLQRKALEAVEEERQRRDAPKLAVAGPGDVSRAVAALPSDRLLRSR